jgi:hypothetical protein
MLETHCNYCTSQSLYLIVCYITIEFIWNFSHVLAIEFFKARIKGFFVLVLTIHYLLLRF